MTPEEESADLRATVAALRLENAALSHFAPQLVEAQTENAALRARAEVAEKTAEEAEAEFCVCRVKGGEVRPGGRCAFCGGFVP